MSWEAGRGRGGGKGRGGKGEGGWCGEEQGQRKSDVPAPPRTIRPRNWLRFICDLVFCVEIAINTCALGVWKMLSKVSYPPKFNI